MTLQISRQLAELSPAELSAVLNSLSPAESATLPHIWRAWARPDQLPPDGDWFTWLLLGGRGSGKTRSAVEWVRDEIESGRRRHVAIVGPTADQTRRVQIEGESGILAKAPPWFRPEYEPSTRHIKWPNGAIAHLFSSEEPDRLRGPNLDAAWCDEVCSWNNPQATWDMLLMALRLTGPQGHAPRVLVSTTPRPMPLLLSIMKAPDTAITKSRTRDNPHLNKNQQRILHAKYGGSTLGRQELDAEVLLDLDGALWTRSMLDRCRVDEAPEHLARVVVAIDPSGGGSSEAGIVVVGKARNNECYVLQDASGRMSPERWASRAVDLYQRYRCDAIVAEKNFGGEMVENTIRMFDRNANVKMVQATRGKAIRAEPVVMLYEQNRVHHVGQFPDLEDQLCCWDPGSSAPSPDRLDAVVWACSDLVVNTTGTDIATWIKLGEGGEITPGWSNLYMNLVHPN
jgi:phage terminase large subunit-like protein